MSGFHRQLHMERTLLRLCTLKPKHCHHSCHALGLHYNFFQSNPLITHWREHRRVAAQGSDLLPLLPSYLEHKQEKRLRAGVFSHWREGNALWHWLRQLVGEPDHGEQEPLKEPGEYSPKERWHKKQKTVCKQTVLSFSTSRTGFQKHWEQKQRLTAGMEIREGGQRCRILLTAP